MKLKDLINLPADSYSANALRELHAKMSAAVPKDVIVGFRSVREAEQASEDWAFYVTFYYGSRSRCPVIERFGKLRICADATMMSHPFVRKVLTYLREQMFII
jgi:hypothetical protein